MFMLLPLLSTSLTLPSRHRCILLTCYCQRERERERESAREGDGEGEGDYDADELTSLGPQSGPPMYTHPGCKALPN